MDQTNPNQSLNDIKNRKIDSTKLLPSIDLPRGGTVVTTSIGPIQLGMPPETIKDSMTLGLQVPMYYIVPSEPFSTTLGENAGINVAEFEFPAYCNFFFKRRPVHLIVHSMVVEIRIRQVFQETLFGPSSLDMSIDFPKSTLPEEYPTLSKELAYFRKFGDKLITIDMLLHFVHFNEDGIAKIIDNDKIIQIIKKNNAFQIIDQDASITIQDQVILPAITSLSSELNTNSLRFSPPSFGVTVLGNSHGFDPSGKTSGYVLWINHRGIMIDPPPFSTSILMASNIPPVLIDGVIVTHCHADHDAGTFQKILQEGKVSVITTRTIYGSFIRKYSALSGLDDTFLKKVLHFRPVKINDPTTILGANFRFFYSLHSIPCIGFEVEYGDKKIAFSGDHLNDHERILSLHKEGILTDHRCHELLNFPWHCDIILHEAGIPPIHTPIKTLEALPEDVQSKLYIVHTAAKDIPKNGKLRAAPEGVEKTLTLPVSKPSNAESLLILNLVRNIDIFFGLNLSHAYELLQMARRKSYDKGSKIITRGSYGNQFYVIVSGEAEVIVPPSATTKSCPRKFSQSLPIVKKYITGDYFGELALVEPGGIRTADIIACCDVSVVEFDAGDFQWMLQGTFVYERIMKLAISRSHFTWDTIGGNSLFGRLTSSQKTQLELALERIETKPGEIIWSRNKPCKIALFVDQGTYFFASSLAPSPSVPGSIGMNYVNNNTITDVSPNTVKRRGSVNRVVPMDFPSIELNKDEGKHFTYGNFVGEVDLLMSKEETYCTTTLISEGEGSILVIQKRQLQEFLADNLGVLMTITGKRYII